MNAQRKPAPAMRNSILLSAAFAGCTVMVGAILPLVAQGPAKPLAMIEADVQAFAIAPDNQIAYAVQRVKRIKKLIVEHDDFWVATLDGKKRKIIDGDKFTPMPFDTPEQLASSPDSAGPNIPGAARAAAPVRAAVAAATTTRNRKKERKGRKKKRKRRLCRRSTAIKSIRLPGRRTAKGW